MSKRKSRYTPPAGVGCETPEYRRMTEAPAPKPAQKADQYIAIPVAEYHFLTKAATLLEVIANDPSYNNQALPAVTATLAGMVGVAAEGGAKE